VTTSRGANPDDSFWRRPTEPKPDAAQPPSGPGPSGPAPASPAPPPYAGPPPTVAPPAGWRPPVHLRPPPPRQLPGQDVPGIEESERGARTLTYGVGLVAGAVLLVVMCLLCSRVLF
jgi:hypothetical protein